MRWLRQVKNERTFFSSSIPLWFFPFFMWTLNNQNEITTNVFRFLLLNQDDLQRYVSMYNTYTISRRKTFSVAPKIESSKTFCFITLAHTLSVCDVCVLHRFVFGGCQKLNVKQ